MKTTKFFAPKNEVKISKEMLDYFRKAEQYAIQHGFKAIVFDSTGKIVALQG